MKWLSTTFGSDESPVAALSPDDILALAASARRITVVSAFFDSALLNRIANAVPKARRGRVELRLYLNASSGRRRVADNDALSALETKWRRLKPPFRSVEIRLIRRAGLFHSKLLVFERKSGHTFLLGSANATTAAYDQNEELMLQVTGGSLSTPAQAYLAALAKHGEELSTLVAPRARTIETLVRDGTLYYKPNALAQFRFDLRLPRSTRAALTMSAVKIPGMQPRLTSITYNPVAGLETTEDLGERGRLLLRPEAIQTCYGWWAPDAYKEIVDAKIAKASRKRSKKVDGLVDMVRRGIRSGELRVKAEQRFRRLRKLIEERKLKDAEALSSRLERFERHLERMREKVHNDQWLRRASCAYAAAVVPEIWDDPFASRDFLDSFFEYVEFANSARSVPKVVRSLRDKAGFGQGASESDIRESLDTLLRKSGWSRELWLEG